MALRWKVKLNWVEALLLDGGSAVFVVSFESDNVLGISKGKMSQNDKITLWKA